MSDADRARATERFFRAETARDTPGSGLGLSLVQAVAQLHGGSLTLADNAPGLRAEIRLPMSAAAGMDATDGFTPRAVLRGEPAGSISS